MLVYCSHSLKYELKSCKIACCAEICAVYISAFLIRSDGSSSTLVRSLGYKIQNFKTHSFVPRIGTSRKKFKTQYKKFGIHETKSVQFHTRRNDFSCAKNSPAVPVLRRGLSYFVHRVNILYRVIFSLLHFCSSRYCI